MHAQITSTVLSAEDGGVEYVISVRLAKQPSQPVTVNRRYSDFDRLLFELDWAGLTLLPLLPGKTLLKHTSGPVLSERIQGLSRFVNELIARPDVRCTEIFRNFLEISDLFPAEGLHAETQMDGSRLPLRDFAVSNKHERKFYVVHGDNSVFARMGKMWQLVEKDELGAFAVLQAPNFPDERTWDVVGSRIYPQQANCVASDDAYVAVGTDTGRVLIYNFTDGNFSCEFIAQPKAELELHGSQPVLGVALQFPILASVGFDCALRVYDISQETLQCGGRLKKRLGEGEVLTRVKLVDRKFAAISSNKNHIFLYDITRSPNPELKHTYVLPSSTEISDFAISAEISDDVPELLVAHDCLVSRVTVAGRTTVAAFPGVRISRIERRGDFLAVGTSDGAVGIVSLVSGRTLAAVRSAFDAEISKIEFLSDRRVAVSAEDGRLRVWRLDGALVTQFEAPASQSQEGSASPKRTVASAALLAEDEEDEWKKGILL